ncbi:MAG: AhpC/TSA family protein [Agarilytica sp.]
MLHILTSHFSRTSLTAQVVALLVVFSVSSELWADKAVAQSAADTCPIQVGETLPSLSLPGLDGKSHDVKRLVAQKPTIMIFYRGGWCPYCNTQLGELKTIEKQILDRGYQVLAISPDLPKNLKKSVSQHRLNFTLLSDSKAEFAKALGLAFRVDEKTNKKLLKHNINLEAASGEKHRILPVPAAIVLNTQGGVEFVFTSPNYKVRVDKNVLLAAAKAAMKN